ncbi:hypothetical protein DVW08_08670 [Clostridium botulinum]|nr:hypothetical protein [Clostridium botulinum]
MAKYMLRNEIEDIIKERKWILNTRIDYKQKFSRSDQLKIICKCGKPQTLGVKSLKNFICPFCKNSYKIDNAKKKVCTLCEKPHNCRTQLCAKCNKQSKDLKISIAKLLTLKEYYQTKDIFKILEEKPFLLYSKVDHKKALDLKRSIREHYKSNEYKRKEYKKWDCEIPPYILNEMFKYPMRELLTLSGDKSNPTVHYICKACGEEQICKFRNLHKGHGCISSKSSGEVLVEIFLKEQNIKLYTQFNTLKCFNPITKRQLPYDIEIIGKRILIEIQGEQHLRFTKYFHGTIENFEYQQRKDDYKRRWAESKGYKVIYIYYNEFANGDYRRKILDAIKSI